MSDNYNDKDFEKLIFGGGLSSSEIEPSEKFWNKAYENILEKENLANKGLNNRWRFMLAAMSASVLFLSAYIIYMHSQISELKQQVSQIEISTKNTAAQNVQQNNTITQVNKQTTDNNQTSKNSTTNIDKQNQTTTVARTIKTNSQINKVARRIPIHTSNNVNKTTQIASQNSTIAIAPTNFNPRIDKTSSLVNKSVEPGSQTTAPSLPNVVNNTVDNTSKIIAPTNVITVQNNTTVTQTAPPNNIASSANKPTNTIVNANAPDTAGSVFTPQKHVTFSDVAAKISASIFYAPGTTDDFLKDKDNDPTHTVTAHVLKSREDGDGTFTTGLRLAYDLSDRWSIQTGCSYNVFSYNINPTVIYAQPQESTGQVGYSIATTSGTIFVPYSGGKTHLGDSIKVKGNSSRGYISIPLQAKYKIAMGRKLCFYTTGGFAVNIANYRQAELHWINTSLQEGDASVQSIYGLNATQFAYNFGLGAEYLVYKSVSVYMEPFMNGSFTSINTNSPVITYPYFFGLAFGATLHF